MQSRPQPIAALNTTVPQLRLAPQPTPISELVAQLLQVHTPSLSKLGTLTAHPRSLARISPSWRPPSIQLPAPGGAFAYPELKVSLARRRLGPRGRVLMQQHGVTERGVYVVTARFSAAGMNPVPLELAQGWVEAWALHRGSGEFDLHQLTAETATTLCWVSDGRMCPLPSPAELFYGLEFAA